MTHRPFCYGAVQDVEHVPCYRCQGPLSYRSKALYWLRYEGSDFFEWLCLDCLDAACEHYTTENCASAYAVLCLSCEGS
jgi:hypothetical protein